MIIEEVKRQAPTLALVTLLAGVATFAAGLYISLDKFDKALPNSDDYFSKLTEEEIKLLSVGLGLIVLVFVVSVLVEAVYYCSKKKEDEVDSSKSTNVAKSREYLQYKEQPAVLNYINYDSTSTFMEQSKVIMDFEDFKDKILQQIPNNQNFFEYDGELFLIQKKVQSQSQQIGEYTLSDVDSFTIQKLKKVEFTTNNPRGVEIDSEEKVFTLEELKQFYNEHCAPNSKVKRASINKDKEIQKD